MADDDSMCLEFTIRRRHTTPAWLVRADLSYARPPGPSRTRRSHSAKVRLESRPTAIPFLAVSHAGQAHVRRADWLRFTLAVHRRLRSGPDTAQEATTLRGLTAVRRCGPARARFGGMVREGLPITAAFAEPHGYDADPLEARMTSVASRHANCSPSGTPSQQAQSVAQVPEWVRSG